MNLFFKKKFLKQLSKLPLEYRKNIEFFVFEELPNLDSIESINNLEKMTGYKNYYKIRFGKYRVGLKIIENDVIFEIVMHRKEIYKFFP